MRHYQQQYADIYFLRLARLKPTVAEIAVAAWEGFNVCKCYFLHLFGTLAFCSGGIEYLKYVIMGYELGVFPTVLFQCTKLASYDRLRESMQSE